MKIRSSKGLLLFLFSVLIIRKQLRNRTDGEKYKQL